MAAGRISSPGTQYDQLEGMTFTIFEDPITEERSEGCAEVIHVFRVTPLDLDHDLVYCQVIFLSHDRDANPRYRTIKVCKQARGTALPQDPTPAFDDKFDVTCAFCDRVLEPDDLICWCLENTNTDHGDQLVHIRHRAAA